ncbi:hypothetical protein GG344DRAFT_71047 [Lentinula edodes]|nr:hypothetical protein GG344DRAFT_71047 [Lentinula edodes]
MTIARKIGCEDLSNLKKINYYPGVQLAYLILNVWMLDCWCLAFNAPDIFKDFQELNTKNAIPPLEVFQSMPRQLYCNYSCTQARHHVFNDAGLPKDSSDWCSNVPIGSVWAGLDDFRINFSKSTLQSASWKQKLPKKSKKKATKAKREAEQKKEVRRHNGDYVLANSIAFMHDALLSRECANTVTSGDVGCVWEVLKVMIFTFSGSSHSKISTIWAVQNQIFEKESTCQAFSISHIPIIRFIPGNGPTVQPPSGYESSSTLLSNATIYNSPDTPSESDDASTSDDSDSDDEYFWHSTGMMEVVNGHVVAQSLDLDQTAEELIVVLEEDLEREKAALGNASCSDTDHDSDADYSKLQNRRQYWYIHLEKKALLSAYAVMVSTSQILLGKQEWEYEQFSACIMWNTIYAMCPTLLVVSPLLVQ